MKAFILLMLISVMQVSASVYSQNTLLNLSLNEVALEEVFQTIENQTEFKFLYKDDMIDVNRKVTVAMEQGRVEDILDEVLSGYPVTYKVLENNLIVITPKNIQSIQQQKMAKGQVVDKGGMGMPGVNVIIKGTTTGTTTDLDGNFQIEMPSPQVTLVFSFIGYTQQEIVADGKMMHVVLQEETLGLDEVVVVGYGTQKKVNVTGAVVSVDSKKIEDRPTENVLKSLQGTVAGVTIISRPGSTSINIRGRGSLGSSSPLYVVDGIEVSSDFFNNMEPSSIENISFLKDASSAAIYGAKAAYGVVLVTTKTGKKGQFKVTYNGSAGFQTPTYKPDVLNSWDYAQMYREAQKNSNPNISESDYTYSLEDIAKYKSGEDLDRYPNTNWFDEVLNDNALFTKHNVQFTGGGEKIKYAFGLGYMKDESLTPGEATDRYNFSSKTTADLKSWLTITSNVNFIYKKYDREKGPASMVEFLRVPPTQVARHSNGEWGSVRDHANAVAEQINANPLRTWAESGRANSDTKHFLGTMSAKVTPMKGLSITNQLGYRYWDYRGFSFQNKTAGVPLFLEPSAGILPGTSTDVNQMNMDWQYSEKLIYDGWANYEKTINDDHNISAMVGFHADSYTYKNLKVGRKDFGSNEMNGIGGGSGDPDKQIKTEGNVIEETSYSYFGRVSYNYQQKYMFEANFRADASSRFFNGNPWGYFPSFSLGWRLDQEDFLANADWLNSLKLRASWGRNGNIYNVGRYDTYATYNANGTVLVGGQVLPLLSEGRIASEELTWETTTTNNIGVDAIFGNGLLGLTLDVYERTTNDILIQPDDVPTETGLDNSSVPARNVGTIRNRGIELGLNHRKEFGDFSYSVGGNLSYNKNKIMDLGGVDQLTPSGYFVYKKGYSVGSFFMYEADGLYSTEDIANGNVIPNGSQIPEAGMVKYVDQKTEDTDGDGKPDAGDGIINGKDRVIVGGDVPEFTYGLNVELNYKNFSLSMVGQGVTGVKVYMDNEASQAFFNNSVPRKWQMDNWTPDNQDAQYPKLFTENDARYVSNTRASSYWLFNASYFRVKNITLSYNLPKDLTRQIGLDKVRVYVSTDNPFTIRGDKRMKDFDPERSSGRGAQLGMKTFTSGISVTF